MEARHGDPFGFLGVHGLEEGARVVRVFRPGCVKVTVVGQKEEIELERVHEDGFFAGEVSASQDLSEYRLRYETGDGHTWEAGDPYACGNLLGEQDLYYLSEGTHREMYRALGAQLVEVNGAGGIRFAVWAPNAQRVSVVGDFNDWDGRVHPMRKRVEAGVWEIFIPDIGFGEHYKFEILGSDGSVILKTDPIGFFSQNGEQTSSITHDLDGYQWGDAAWVAERDGGDPYKAPMSIYEVHLGSWKRVPEEGGRPLSYRELADQLPEYVKGLGFTHIELMPITEYPFDGSWGYQVGCYFSPTSRFGAPDDFRYFVDRCHQMGIGVLLDWVPAHFPKDEHGLARFDGSPLYEHADPRQGEHTDWGTLIFNYGRNEVKGFLIANALFWLEQYHLDGLRVDAVASMLYLDYSREDGEWLPNEHGGRENLEAIAFLKELNEQCYAAQPGTLMMAEESTSWGGVSKPTSMGGLGFGFKWNMGWMNDQLGYIERDPIHRCHHHGEATFSMVYAFDENFVLVLSHDEVVHGKGSMLDKMPGDRWQKFANLRMFLAWMYAHPGKKLLFMGIEMAMWREWNHDSSLDWHLLQEKDHAGIHALVKDLNALHVDEPAMHRGDHDSSGFCWLDHDGAADSTFSFLRLAEGAEPVVFGVNATPVARKYRMGVPASGFYKEVLNTDAEAYGGSNVGNYGGVESEEKPWQNQPHSIEIELPPLATVGFRLG